MTEDSKNIQKNIGVDSLTDGMIIVAYTGFNEKYRPMDETTCKWVKLNFKGASIVVERDGGKKSIPIENAEAGDIVYAIGKLPESLKNIKQVNVKLVKELKDRGFLQFDVQPPKAKAQTTRPDMKQAVDQANLFVQKVKESVQVCRQAADTVENFIDNARQGKTDLKEIEGQISGITDGQSSDAISAIISLKENDQVYAHCVDVAVVFRTVYLELVRMKGMKSVFKDEKELMLAAFLHDIGKAKVPKEILDSTAPFKRKSKEMQLIRTHPETGAKMLEEMGLPYYFSDMAHHHHVKFDHTMASSYPEGVEYKTILFESQLLGLVDAYQALTAGRSYKKSWTPPAVMRYLDATAGVEFGLSLWQDFQKVMGHYPRGSFVKLSDNTQGFVVSVPDKEVLRPQVAITRNASGEDLDNQYLIDLQLEKDVSIVQDIDVKEIYGDKALEIFANVSIN